MLIHKSKENKVQKSTFDGFDCNGKPTGNKCIVCIHQNIKCPYQSFFGEGAALICTYNLENCFKDIEEGIDLSEHSVDRVSEIITEKMQEQKSIDLETVCNIFCHTGCPHKIDSYNCLKDKCDALKAFKRMMAK